MVQERVASNHISKTKPILKVQIMVVDDDNTSLSIVSTMLKRCNEQGNINIELVVFSFNNPLDALATLRTSKDRFDLILTDLHMPGMNGMDLQKNVNEEFKIPVIIMSSDDKDSVIIQSLEDGASFYLVKPVTGNDLRNVWQYAVTAKKGKSVATHCTDDDAEVVEGDGETPSSNSDKVSVDNDVGNSASSVNETTKVMKKNGNKKVTGKKRSKDAHNEDEDDENEDDEDYVNRSAPKKAKVVWTNSLHNRFLQAINHIGLDKAVPKKILEFMNVPGLTRENVASHLQKYRIFLKRVRERIRNPPRNFSEGPNMSSFASSLIQEQQSQLAFHPGSGFRTAAQASSLSCSTLARPRHAAYAYQNLNTTFVPGSTSIMRGSRSSTSNLPQYGGSSWVYNQPHYGGSNMEPQGSRAPIRRVNPVSAIGNIESPNYNSLINLSSSQFLCQNNANNNNNNNKNYAGFRVAGDGSIYASGAQLQLSNHCPSNSGAIGNGSIDPYQLQPPNLPNVVEGNTSLLPVLPPNNVHTQNEATMFNTIPESRIVESEIDLDALLEAAEDINNNNNFLHNQVQERQELVDTNSITIVNDVTNQGFCPTFEQPQENGKLMDFELNGMLSAENNSSSSSNLPSWGDVFMESLLADYPF